MAEEARMTISNLVPLMKHKYGTQVLTLFTPSAVERMEGCHWDPHQEIVVGQYDDEIKYLDEEDPMQTYIKPKHSPTPSSNASTTLPTTVTPNIPPQSSLPSSNILHDMDDDSVSTLGYHTHRTWKPSRQTQPPSLLTQRPHIPSTPTDDASTGSVSTLTTRLTTMETQYNQLSGAVQDIKTMLAGLAKATYHSGQDEPPTNVQASQGSAPTGSGS